MLDCLNPFLYPPQPKKNIITSKSNIFRHIEQIGLLGCSFIWRLRIDDSTPTSSKSSDHDFAHGILRIRYTHRFKNSRYTDFHPPEIISSLNDDQIIFKRTTNMDISQLLQKDKTFAWRKKQTNRSHRTNK